MCTDKTFFDIPTDMKSQINMLRLNLQNITYYEKYTDGGSKLANNMKKDLETKLKQALNGLHNNSICHCNKDNKDGKGAYFKTKNPNMRAKTKLELLQKLYDYYFAAEKWTFEEMDDAWIKSLNEDVKNEIITYNTLAHHKSIYNRFIKCSLINDKKIVDIKVSEITKFYKICVGNQKITRNDSNNIKTVMNGVFEYANQEHDLEVVMPRTINTRNLPCREITHTKYTNSERETLIQYAVNCEEEWAAVFNPKNI